MKTHTLTNGSIIRVAGVRNKVTVCTLAAYAARTGKTVESYIERDIEFCRETKFAWTHQAASVLESNYLGRDEARAIERAQIQAAPLVESGDRVVIDGIAYVAKVAGDYSDPVYFNVIA